MNNNIPYNNIININDNKNEEENIYQTLLNKLNKNKIINNNEDKLNNFKNNEEEESKKIKNEEKNSFQQVDFVYHPNEPENNSSIKNILIKQYKKRKKIIPEEEENDCKKNINKLNTKKININKQREIPYSNKNKGLFDPYLTKRELDYESKIKKEREERQKKIDNYEKEQNKKKLQKDINNKILNYKKPKTKPLINAKNFSQKKIKKNEEDLIKHFVKVPKPKIEKKMAKNFGFNPKKYDMIINTLLNEIDEVKNERKKENEMFKKQIQLYAHDNVTKYNNYYEFIYKKQQLNYDKKKFINSKSNKNNNKITRAQIINSLMKKYFDKDNPKFKDINENKILKEINLADKNNNDSFEIKIKNKNKLMKNNDINNLLLNNQEKINQIDFDSIDKLLSSENLTFQDKINILTSLNKNLDNYYKEIPSFVNQVKTSLNKLYQNDVDNNNFVKEANKVPFVAMASRAAFQIIQSNNDQIIENIIDELLYECTYDMNIIEEKKKNINEKEKLLKGLDKVKEKINDIPKNEEEILEKLHNFLQKNEQELKNKIDKEIININKNKVQNVKYEAYVDNNFISERNKYQKEFRTFMEYKGSFYYNDIFNIYDQFIEEESENILEEIIDNYINDIHNHARNLVSIEINNLNEN